MTNNEILKKQILYRSTHRGTKEMDLLLGSFVKKNINQLSDVDLEDLDKLMMFSDDVLEKWFFDIPGSNVVPTNSVSKKLKNFKI